MIDVWKAIWCGLCVAAGVGCSSDPGGMDERAARIVVTPGQASILQGDTLRLSSQIYDAEGRVLLDAPILWSAPDTLTATVTDDGLVYGRAPGNVALSVTSGTAVTHVNVAVSATTGGWRTLGTLCGIWEGDLTYCWLWNLDSPWNITMALMLTGVPALHGIRFGLQHACGLTVSGEAYCWGENDFGQVGDGTTVDRPTPVPVTDGVNFDSIAVGALHSCAITRAGQAYCWGGGRVGQLGVGIPPELCNGMPCSRRPVAVAGNHRFRSIATGGNDPLPGSYGLGLTCALNDTGRAFCWGANSVGSVGDGSRTDRSIPTEVVADESFVAIATGASHACALTRDGQAQCWGSGFHGQIGIITPAGSAYECAVGDIAFPCISTPMTVLDHRFRAIAAANYNTCALNSMGAAFCWGRNQFGEIGNGSITAGRDARTPSRVVGGQTFLDIKTANSATCALTPTRGVMCWGNRIPYPQPVPEPTPRR
ncbi:MAG: Ig-like domain-containing protein [Longimicrobiales bacterium]